MPAGGAAAAAAAAAAESGMLTRCALSVSPKVLSKQAANPAPCIINDTILHKIAKIAKIQGVRPLEVHRNFDAPLFSGMG